MMKKVVKATLGLMLVGSAVFAQSLADAKKAIDAEQYQKGKAILKTLTGSQPDKAENYFYLGNIYLKTDYPDSAKMTYNKGISIDAAYPLNYVGLGTVALAENNESAAQASFDKAISLTGKKDHKTYLFIGKAYTKAAKPNADAAITNLEKAKTINAKDAEVYLALGDAYRTQMKNSEAYSAYRTAFDMNKSLLRAKVELGVINKMSKAFKESADEFNEVVALDANYGPAYRELAETYYLWANAEPKQYDERINQALQYYEKYMDLTDRSLESRIRHADFLILTKKWKELEAEANEMAKIDKVNPKVLRYLAYSSYENGNYAGSVQALNDFISKVEPTRIIAKDYLYLGRAQMKTPGAEADGVNNLKKAVDLDSTNAEVMSEIGLALFKAKKYDEASKTYEIAVRNPQSKTIVYDSFYLGLSHYFNYASQNNAKLNPSKDLLVKADTLFSYVIQRSPTSPDAYLYRARVGKQLDDEQASKGLMVPYFEKYIELVTAKEEAKAAPTDTANAKTVPTDAANKATPSDKTKILTPAVKSNLVEAYTNLGAYYQKTDKAKAKEYFNKVIELDPANAYAASALQALKGKAPGKSKSK